MKKVTNQNLLRTEIPRVVLLIETSREPGRSIMRGIEKYARLYGPWSFHFSPGDLIQHFAGAKALHPSGIIARIETPEVEHAILESQLPTVAIDLYEEQKSYGAFRNTSEIRVNNDATGRMAAEHFLNLDYKNFAFVGEIRNVLWSREREQGFAKRLEEAGFTCDSFPLPHPPQTWSLEVHTLGRWLQRLPKPVGILAAMDVRGRQIISTCQVYGIRVPDEVAVLGVGNDPLLCSMCEPTLSSIALDATAGGFQAATILDLLMKDKLVGKRDYVIPPLHVEMRESTRLPDILDPVVADAIRFIKMNNMAPLNASDVARYSPLSRRVLEIRFRKATGHSILEEVNRLRLERVQNMLLKTEMKIHEIAETCGFCTSSYLSRFFRREAGMSIADFLKKEKKRKS
ncbi:MAG: DNA-binding transcriptional regulator [Planctomycetia bacterium]|nr:DNA-binding transcriptional regulator [Planctomycetia bacterium]